MYNSQTVALEANYGGFTVSKTNPNVCYAATEKNSIFIFENLAQTREIKLKYQPSALEVTNDGNLLLIGDKVCSIFNIINAYRPEIFMYTI